MLTASTKVLTKTVNECVLRTSKRVVSLCLHDLLLHIYFLAYNETDSSVTYKDGNENFTVLLTVGSGIYQNVYNVFEMKITENCTFKLW